MREGKIFNVEINHCRGRGYETAVSLELPAGPHELLDAFARARINEGEAIETELLETELDFLYERLPGNPDLLNLNHLAHQLAALEEWQLCAMEGLCEVAEVRSKGQPISVAELVNMAGSLDDCQIAYDIHSDKELGWFYDENGMLPETEGLPEQVRDLIDYRALGEKRRQAEGGVFTRAGYVVLNGYKSQDYAGGQQPWPQPPEAAITATLYPTDRRYIEGCVSEIIIRFPVSEQALPRFLGQIGVKSLYECSLRVKDCAAPQMEQAIEGHFRKNKSLDEINEFVAALGFAEAHGMLPKFKAMLAATECSTLAAANRLAGDIYQCDYDPNFTSPSAYATQKMISMFPGISKKDLVQNVSLDALGRLLLKAENIYHTEYGMVNRKDGQPLIVQSQAAPQAAEYDSPELEQEAGPVMEM